MARFEYSAESSSTVECSLELRKFFNVNLSFEARGFAEKSLNVTRRMDSVGWDDLFKAAITVGHRDEAALVSYGVHSWFEALTRFYRIKLALDGNQHTCLALTPLFKAMDPSEKAALSYYLGLTFCKLYAERHLRVPWLMHHDVYRKFLGSQLTNGVRPDLVGLSVNNRWASFEAKGYRRQCGAKARQRAKQQALSLSNVRGQPITWSVASWTRISTTCGISLQWEDPPPEDSNDPSAALNLSIEDLFKHYYSPLVVLEDLNSDGARSPISRATLPRNLGISVSLDRKLSNLVRENRYSDAYEYLRARAAGTTGIPQASDYGMDGVKVEYG